jgi:gluconolactonase
VYGPPFALTPAPVVLTATKVVDGFAFTEGPVWVADQGVLLFSDIQSASGSEGVQPSKIQRLQLPAATSTWLDTSGSNGIALSADGDSLIACTHDMQSVSSYRLSDKQRGSVIGMDDDGKKFHSPNDVAVHSGGTVYFTDPSFQQGNRPNNVVATTAAYRVAPSGELSVVDATIANPNGVALSPDEKTLYVGGAGNVWKYAVDANGATGTAKPFASGLNAPDGMTVDCAGNVYVAEFNTGKVHVYSSSGTELGVIQASTHSTNAAFGGSDGKTLFITSGGAASGGYGIYAIELDVPGLPY